MLWFMGSQRVGHDWVTELRFVYGYFIWCKKYRFQHGCLVKKNLEDGVSEQQFQVLRRIDDAEVEAPILWPHIMKSQLIGKVTDAGEGQKSKEKGVAEDEMVR